MQLRTVWLCLLLFACLSLIVPSGSTAAVTAEHRKQVDEIVKEVRKVSGLITKKEFDEAAKALSESEKRLKDIAKEAGVEVSHKLVAVAFSQIEKQRAILAKKQKGSDGAAGAGPFEKEVAPLVVARCLKCHGADDPKANLSLATFGGIVAGCGGKLVVPGNPESSILYQRLTANANRRMPKGGPALAQDELKKIYSWIAGGAKFGGDNAMLLTTLVEEGGGGKRETGPIEIVKANGDERVKFTRDIAPFMANLCVGCHSGPDPRSGFSLETFEKLMRGGRDGRVILPGNTKDSRLWHLVGEQDPIKMPPGQALITETNHAKLRIWIEEGAKFDGTDAQAKAPLRSLVPTAEELRARELASLSAEEFANRRHERAMELWQTAFTKDTPAEAVNDEVIVIGNVAEPRIKEISDWVENDAKTLKKTFGIKEPTIWRGKLIVFAFNDHFSYSEFVQTNEKKELPSDMKGHSRVTSTLDEAYICLEEQGDDAREASPGTHAMLWSLLTEALLQRSPNRVPEWAARGMGLVLAFHDAPKNPYFHSQGRAASEALKSLDRPQELFEAGTFSAADAAPVGFTLVSHMIKAGRGGEAEYVRFLGQLSMGKSLSDALKTVYATDPLRLAQAYLATLPHAKAGSKKARSKP
ncbi:MAG: hypothetical protein EXS05_02610 [Planctomycetaceae bacterium]|nr:hypothetical protein [Planctomycetaceae bacterium]